MVSLTLLLIPQTPGCFFASSYIPLEFDEQQQSTKGTFFVMSFFK
jgi:hypothetical protein